MSWFSGNDRPGKAVKWTPLTAADQIYSAFDADKQRPTLLFKHSTRCSISAMALNRFESEWNQDLDCDLLFLDLLKHRDLSNRIAEVSGIQHESPQAILVVSGKVVYNASHNAISATQIEAILKDIKQR
jgi:bacillithiol system protein YtxJ